MCIIMTLPPQLMILVKNYTMYDVFVFICFLLFAILGCEDCGNQMFTKYHPGVYGLTVKSHWSCCGAARETGGCSQCHQLSSSDEQDSTPEPQIMYINPLVEPHLTATDTTKVR